MQDLRTSECSQKGTKKGSRETAKDASQGYASSRGAEVSTSFSPQNHARGHTKKSDRAEARLEQSWWARQRGRLSAACVRPEEWGCSVLKLLVAR